MLDRPARTMLSALDLAAKVEAGAITPADVVEQCAETIAAREDEIGAFAHLDLDGARKAAREDGARLAAAALRGLPVGIKDIYDTADLPTEYGSTAYKGNRPAADAAVVAMVRRAGGLVLGKTVTTEFAHLQPGRTRNPANLAHTPGGSSSGSAAAVAAGMMPVATGSQTGGSGVGPAAFCGVAGYKASYKLIPTVGMKCFSWSLDTVGFFAAGIADVAFAAAAISGRDLRVDRGTPAAPRLALLRTHIWAEASPDMQRATEEAARRAETAGASVKDIVLPPLLEDAWRAHTTVQQYEAYRALAFEYDRHRDTIGPMIRALLEKSAAITHDDYDIARRTTKRARQALADLMHESQADAIITPSAPGAAPNGLESTGQATFNRLWTLMGPPCVNVPGMTDASGLPLGVQIVGRFGRDRGALEAALFLERAIAPT